MKIRKLSFKRIALVASLALAGFLGISSSIITSVAKTNPVVEEVKADDSDYIVVYCHVACTWGRDVEFDSNVSNGHFYKFKVNNKESKNCYYGSSAYSGDSTFGTSFSQVLGPKLVKIYLPLNATHVQFVGVSGTWNRCYSGYISLENKNGKAWVLSSGYHWENDWGSYQPGEWIDYNDLIDNWFRHVYVTVSTSWNSGQSNLKNLWIWSQVTLFDPDRSSYGYKYEGQQYCCYWLTNRPTFTKNGNTYIDILVPDSDYVYLEKMRIQTVYGSPSNKQQVDEDLLENADFTYLENPTFYVSSNNDSSKQVGFWRDLDDTSQKLGTSDGNLLFRKYYNCPRGSRDWNDAGAQTAVYFWDDSGHYCWSKIATDDYKYTTNSGSNYNDYFVNPTNTDYTWTHFKFVRLNNTCTTPDWGSVWKEGPNMVFNSSYNCYGPKYNDDSASDIDWLNVTGITYFVSDTQFYLDLSDYEANWEDSGAVIGAYLYGSNVYSDVTFIQMKVVEGFVNSDQSKNTALYELILPEENFTNIIFARLNPTGQDSKGASGWWIQLSDGKYHQVWNQTADLKRYTNNVFKLSDANGNGSFAWTMTNDGRSMCFGRYFNECVVCNGQGMTKDEWSNTRNEYNSMCTTIQGIVWLASGNPGGNDLEIAMSKYDYIVKKYGESQHPDYINRKSNSNSIIYSPSGAYRGGYFNYLITDESSTSTIIIIIASSISILSITALSVLLVKKRKTKEQ